jgi:hypothetical protein
MKAIELFEVNIQRSEALLKLHKDSFPIGRPISEGPPADLLRAIIVFEIAALDAYVHKRIIEVLKRFMFIKKVIPEKSISVITKKFKDRDGYREILNLAIQKNPENKILHLAEDSLSFMTFQKPNDIILLFDLINIKNAWKEIDKFLIPSVGRKKKGRKQEAKGILLSLSLRRDEIVHKNDMYVSNKYHGKIKPIGRKEVADSLGRLRRIVFAIEKISEI